MTTDLSPSGTIWLRENDVRSLVSLNDAIDALSEGLRLEATDGAANVDKALGQWNVSSMHTLGSLMPARGYVGFKSWANTPKGAAAVFSLFSAEDGRLLALMEAGAIGSMRTAAISGLATRMLMSPGADELALIGTGMQAMMQIASIAAVLPLRRIRVFSPTPEKRQAFIARAKGMFDAEIVEAQNVEEAVADAPIITLMTRAKEPFLQSSMVTRGAHINAVGAILPGNAEVHQEIFDRTGLVVVDSKANAAKSSQEFGTRFGKDPAQWGDVLTLGEALERNAARPADADLTLFKSMGMGLSDLAVAILAYERAIREGVGTALAAGDRAPPVWHAFAG